jgi:hypothetical protein
MKRTVLYDAQLKLYSHHRFTEATLANQMLSYYGELSKIVFFLVRHHNSALNAISEYWSVGQGFRIMHGFLNLKKDRNGN